MRHVIGIGLAVGLAAAVFFAASWGYLRLLGIPVANGGASTLPAQGGGLLHDSNVLYAFAAVAGTALLAGIFIALRVVYTVLYLADKAAVRSLVWLLGLVVTISLFALGA